MRKSLSRFLPALLMVMAFSFPPSFCRAQDQDTTEVYDGNENDLPSSDKDNNEENANIEPVLRTIAPDTITSLKDQPAFYYMTYLDSLLRAEQRAKDNKPAAEEEVDNSPSFWDAGIVKLICWLVAIGLVGFVLYKLFLDQKVFFRNKKAVLPVVELEDTPHDNDLEKALQQAVRKGDYRMATRYLFLLTLSRLGEKGALQLSTEKTNYQYARELANKPYANQFARLSLQYEYVWFGGFIINENQFAALQQQHQQFLKEI